MCLVRVFQLLVATDTKSRMLCTSETRITTETASPMTTAPFTLRPAAAADLEEWGRVAGLAFAFKGGDPGRFLKNHTADGEAEDSDIHLACRDDDIAAAIRVLRKRIYINGSSVVMRGFGDVCTHPEYQRQGAAGQIITGILREFEEERVSRGGRIVAALHAMESMRPFYAKYGFKSVNAQRSLLSIPWPETATLPATSCVGDDITFRPAEFPTDIPQLSQLYGEWSSNFNGTHVRSETRWATWIPHSIGPALWVAESHTEEEDGTTRHRIVAFAAARYKAGAASVAEFATARDLIADGSASILLIELMQRSLPSVCPPGTAGPHMPTLCALPVLRLVLPPLIARVAAGELHPCLPLDADALRCSMTSSPGADDDGWMYMDISVPEGEESTVDFLARDVDKHVVCLTDFF